MSDVPESPSFPFQGFARHWIDYLDPYLLTHRIPLLANNGPCSLLWLTLPLF